MRQRFAYSAVLEGLDVFINVVDACLVKIALPSLQLRPYKSKGAVHFFAVDIRDRAEQMRKRPELVRHSAALKVDDHKSHLIGMIVHCNGQHIRLQKFRFARSGRAGDESVRSVRFIVQVKIYDIVDSDADRDSHGLLRRMRSPSLCKIKVFRGINAQQLVKRDALCELPFQGDLIRVDRRQFESHVFDRPVIHRRIAESGPPALIVGIHYLARILRVHIYELIAVHRYIRLVLPHEQESAAVVRRIPHEPGRGVCQEPVLIIENDHDLPVSILFIPL